MKCPRCRSPIPVALYLVYRTCPCGLSFESISSWAEPENIRFKYYLDDNKFRIEIQDEKTYVYYSINDQYFIYNNILIIKSPRFNLTVKDIEKLILLK